MEKKNKKEKIVYTKIEVDKKTSEPLLVDVPVKEMEDNFDHATKKPKPSHEEKEKHMESAGKQLVMNKVFGVDKTESVNKKQALFKRLASIFFIVFVIAVLAFTVYNDLFSSNATDLPSIGQILGVLGANWYYAVFALVALFFCYFLKAFKLAFLCKFKTGKWHFGTCLGTAILGHYYNYITPLAVGGQPFEIYHLSKHGVHGGVASSLPIATFFLLQLGFVVLAITSLVLYNTNFLGVQTNFAIFPAGLTVLAIIGIVCCFFVPLLVVIFSIFPKLGGKLVYFVIWIGSKLGLVKDRKVLNYKTTKTVLQNSKCLKSFASNPFVFIVSFLASIGENLALCSIAYFTLRFFGFDLPEHGFSEWVQICTVCMLLYAAISFIPTPGNSGAADITFYALFKVGLTSIGGIAFPAVLVWRLLSFYSFIIIGFTYTKISKAVEKRKAEKVNL